MDKKISQFTSFISTIHLSVDIRPYHNFLSPCQTLMFHTNVVHDLVVCHAFTGSHISQVKVIAHTKQKSVSWPSLLTTQCCIWIILHTIVLHDLMVSQASREVISPRSRSQHTQSQNMCLGHHSLLQCCIWIILHTFVVHDLMVSQAFTRGHIS